MRRTIQVWMVAGFLLIGSAAVRAQEVDSTTGIMVDPATDPMDFADMQMGVPTNAGMEIAAQQEAQAQAQREDQQEQDFMASTVALTANNSTEDDSAPAAPAAPSMAKPTVSPKAGKYAGPVTVMLADKDAGAVFYYTLDGSKPTEKSPVYNGPIAVSSTEKLRVLAEAQGYRPSSVVTAKYKVRVVKA